MFKMVAPKWNREAKESFIEKEPYGIAYEVLEDGEFKELWRAHGWYASHGYLSRDGRYFVRFGPWATDQENHTDLAIAFYDQGRLLKQYEVRELIKEPDKLEDSVSHYNWSPEKQSKADGFYYDVFHLVMVDKTTYDFDFTSGEIKVAGRDELAKSSHEIFDEKQAAARKKGLDLLEASPFQKAYREHFEIDHASAGEWITSGCSLEGPAWSGELEPRRSLLHPASVSAQFPIKEDRYVEVKLTPQDIYGAIEKAFKHPFVKDRFSNGGATGIRLRIQGDRLHWNTPELLESIKKTKGEILSDRDVSHWAYFIVDAKDPSFTSLYLDTQKGDIILEDMSRWPWEPFIIGPNGENMNRYNPSAAKGLLPSVGQE